MSKALIGSVIVLSLFLNSGWSLWSKKENTETSSGKGSKLMSEMTIEEAKKKLQEAEKVLQETKVQAERAEKRYLTLEEMLEAHSKVAPTLEDMTLIPSSIKNQLGDDMIGSYNKLISDLIEISGKIANCIFSDAEHFSSYLIDKTSNLEDRLKASVESLNRVVSRYPSPDLVQLRDQIESKLREIKQVSDAPFEELLTSAGNHIKDGLHYASKAKTTRESKLFDDSAVWRSHLSDSVNRARLISKSAGQRLLELKGALALKKFSVFDTDLGKVISAYTHEYNLAWDEEDLWGKTLSKEDRIKKAEDIVNKAEPTIIKAREANRKGDVDEAFILYDHARFVLSRTKLYLNGLELSKVRELVSRRDVLKGESDVGSTKIATLIREKSAKFFSDFKDRLRSIEASLKDAQAYQDEAERVLRYHAKNKISETEKRQAASTSLTSMKEESQAVKVSLDGTITPYNEGDPLNEGDRIGYTYTSIGQLPSTDAGDAFNGLSGRKRRAVSSSVRVLNTQNLEIGASFDKMVPIKELKSEALVRGLRRGNLIARLLGDLPLKMGYVSAKAGRILGR